MEFCRRAEGLPARFRSPVDFSERERRRSPRVFGERDREEREYCEEDEKGPDQRRSYNNPEISDECWIMREKQVMRERERWGRWSPLCY